VLAPDRGCAEVLKSFLAWLALTEGRCASPNTAAYCRARRRLPLEEIETLQATVAARVEESVPRTDRLWQGRRVKVVDGSSVSMPDTAPNQAAYPQPEGQKPGCGFPVMRILAVFSLSSGVLLHFAKSALTTGERTLFRALWDTFERGEVILADAGFCGYAEFALLAQRGLDCVMRNHPCRRSGLTLLKQLGDGDRLIEWHRTTCRPAWLTREQWLALPERLAVREVTFSVGVPGFRTERVTLATTLTDHQQFPAKAMAELYGRRWRAELFLRDIKITLGMDILRCKTPAMLHKELCMHLIAYNLIRALMLKAAREHHVTPLSLSLKGACATVRHFAPMMANDANDPSVNATLQALLLSIIARDRIPNRPNRTEPRARKRRPKNYQLLNKPRHEFKEIPHRNKHRKP
jgi:hypothetical protein